MKQSPGVSVPEGMKPGFMKAMAAIFDDQQRVVEEDLLCFGLANVMLFCALSAVAFIPVKAFDPQKIQHSVYYHNIRLVQGRAKIFEADANIRFVQAVGEHAAVLLDRCRSHG